jgi:hypothetical protein
LPTSFKPLGSVHHRTVLVHRLRIRCDADDHALLAVLLAVLATDLEVRAVVALHRGPVVLVAVDLRRCADHALQLRERGLPRVERLHGALGGHDLGDRQGALERLRRGGLLGLVSALTARHEDQDQAE